MGGENRHGYDFKVFYKTKIGRVVRRIVRARIGSLWPHLDGLRVMGCGYAAPYLQPYMREAERVFSLSGDVNSEAWPSGEGVLNRLCVTNSEHFPLENSSIDRAIIVHGYEIMSGPSAYMAEVHRVLKPEGQVLLVVPNRNGWWMKAEWSPFGHGQPFTRRQICRALQEYGFVCEAIEGALFIPPVKFNVLLRSARALEAFGRFVVPAFAGVHVIEARKEVFAGAGRGPGSKVSARVPGFMPVPQTQMSGGAS